jgi:hypothetical protein
MITLKTRQSVFGTSIAAGGGTVGEEPLVIAKRAYLPAMGYTASEYSAAWNREIATPPPRMIEIEIKFGPQFELREGISVKRVPGCRRLSLSLRKICWLRSSKSYTFSVKPRSVEEAVAETMEKQKVQNTYSRPLPSTLRTLDGSVSLCAEIGKCARVSRKGLAECLSLAYEAGVFPVRERMTPQGTAESPCPGIKSGIKARVLTREPCSRIST